MRIPRTIRTSRAYLWVGRKMYERIRSRVGDSVVTISAYVPRPGEIWVESFNAESHTLTLRREPINPPTGPV